MRIIKAILAIGVVIIIVAGVIFLLVLGFKNQARFQEEKENSFWECIENNIELEWCLKHFH